MVGELDWYKGLEALRICESILPGLSRGVLPGLTWFPMVWPGPMLADIKPLLESAAPCTVLVFERPLILETGCSEMPSLSLEEYLKVVDLVRLELEDRMVCTRWLKVDVDGSLVPLKSESPIVAIRDANSAIRSSLCERSRVFSSW